MHTNQSLIIYTIGLGEQTFSQLEHLLSEHAITTVVDVRSDQEPGQPDSDSLAGECRVFGLGYVWMGDRLGSRPRHPALFGTDGEPRWRAVTKSPGFNAGLGELRTLAAQGRVVVLCSEESPDACHRSFVIASALETDGVEVLHILSTGLRRHQPTLEL